MNKRAKIIDLFCGAGGFSLGAHLAGFQSAAGIDIDTNLTSSFLRNFPHANLIRSDITCVSGSDVLREAKLKQGDVAGIIGGPPCQGFSLIGKRDSNDPRNKLLLHFCRIVEELRPRFFIMENVPGLLLGNAKSALDEALSRFSGFEILGPILVDAHDFGAATKRERVVIVGYDRAHVSKLTVHEFDSAKTADRNSVLDAIADLPEPADLDWLPYRKSNADLSVYAKRARSLPGQSLGSKEYRDRQARKEVSGVRKTVHTPAVVARFREVQPGGTDSISRCPRLKWSEPSPTLRAGTGPERGSYQSIRPIHPSADRVITVREAARLQGFPDWFQFHPTKWHSFRMIGNSVSPAMAESLLGVISRHVSP